MAGKLIKPLRFLLPFVIMAIAVLALTTGLKNLRTGREEEAKQQLEDAVRRSCISCYAAEGAYPDHIEYLEEYYGLQVDRERFIVFYEVFAQNLMPDISVISCASGK